MLTITPSAYGDDAWLLTSEPPQVCGALASELRHHRLAIAGAMFDHLRGWGKFQTWSKTTDRRILLKTHFLPLIDYLCLLLETGDEAYGQLFIAARRVQFFGYDNQPMETLANRATGICREDEQALGELLRATATVEQAELLDRLLAGLHAAALRQARKPARVLLVGDCLHLDVAAFLVTALAAEGLDLQPTYITTKNPAEAAAQIRRLADQSFDLAFYSPHTYEFALPLITTTWLRNALQPARWVRRRVQQAMQDCVSPILAALASTLPCNLFVHNTSAIRRHGLGRAERLKTLLTRRIRTTTRSLFNAQLDALLAKLAAPHVHLLDERSLLERIADQELGRLFYDDVTNHPAMIGKHLKDTYQDLIAVHTRLLSRKVVVCDLDNTLWEGVIGEGAVRHHLDRQKILAELRRKGVLLTINSKNDPRNIRWEGAALSEADFVHSQINWSPKPQNMQRTAQALNLKLKDLVFLDDRPDERELMRLAHPSVLDLDSCSLRVWRRLELWSRLLPEQTDVDRTRLYQERARREKFIGEQNGSADASEMFHKLGITVRIRRALNSDLPRLAELINRTNQFNLDGSRVTIAEMKSWHDSADHRIFAVECADKFGSNGVVSAVVAGIGPESMCIRVFVLSCRVFGYGVETAVLNHLIRTLRRPGQPVAGLFKTTDHNQPCHRFYPDSGFTQEGDRWILRGKPALQDPAWLTVLDESRGE